MENSLGNQFDQYIKGSLENIEAPYNPATWDMLEQKMDEAAVRDVDEAARQAVSDLSVPYNSATWQILSDRLDRLDYRRKLIALKFVEAAIILLALVTAVRFIQQVPNQKELTQQQQMALLDSQNADEQNIRPDIFESAVENKTSKEDLTNELSIDDSRLRSGLNATIDATTRPSQIPKKVSSATPQQRSALNDSKIETRAMKLMVPNPALVGVSSLLVENERAFSPLANLAAKDLTVEYPRSNLTRDMMAESLVGLPTLNVKMIMHEDMPISLASVAPKIRNTKILTTRLGVYRQASEHTIRQILPGRVIKTQNIKNDAAGVMTSVQSGMLGFDFGLAYERLNFYGERSEMELHKVQVPLNLRVVPISNRYFDVYLKGGATAHGVLYANYEGLNAYSRGARTEYGRKYTDGLLSENGVRTNNMYYSLNYGVGLEVKAFENWSIFVESMMQNHHKGELGNNGIKIKSRMLNMGINRTL